MAELLSSDLSLLGLPAEIRLTIFDHLFADCSCQVAEGEGCYYFFEDMWPVTILETCSLFHHEAKQALRAVSLLE